MQQVDPGLASLGQRPITQQNVPGASTAPVRPPRAPSRTRAATTASTIAAASSAGTAPATDPKPRPLHSPPESRPNYLRKNTEIDEPAPSTPPGTALPEGNPMDSVPTLEGITLADIPQTRRGRTSDGAASVSTSPEHGALHR